MQKINKNKNANNAQQYEKHCHTFFWKPFVKIIFRMTIYSVKGIYILTSILFKFINKLILL